jgi:TRAP-type C4-dicarboxylate transport system substrate-binding protein
MRESAAGNHTRKLWGKEAAVHPRTIPPGAGLLLAAALALAATACGAGNLDKAGNPTVKPVVLTLADGNTGDTSDAQPFAAAVWKLSHGTLQIKIEGNWRPTDAYRETGLINDVRAGKAQLGITASRAFDTVGITSFQALQAPFLIDSTALERKVLDSNIPAKMLAGLRPHGLVGLALLPGPLRRPFGFIKPLLAAADYKGARIGIRPSAVSADIFRALGAIPVAQKQSNSGQSTAGLTGIEANANLIDSGFAVPHAVLTGNVVFEPRPNVIFMNQHAYAALTAGQRTVLARAAAQARTAGIFQGNDIASVADLCRRGIKVVPASPADLAGLQAAVRPVYTMLESNPSTKAYIAQITAMRQASGDPTGAVTCPKASPGGTATGAVALQGTWQVTYTQGELAAAGDTTSIPAEGNWGQFTLRLDQGRWWQRLTGGDPGVDPSNVLLYGTYVVTGDKINFYRHDHDYPGSDTEIWGPYIWSVYRDTLTFKTDGWTGVTQGPIGLTVKPWNRIVIGS